MSLPKIGHGIKERKGVNAFSTAVTDAGHIWRENPLHDMGIDGQVEYVKSNGEVTGKIIGIQIKTGASYFSNETSSGWKYYLDKHEYYWESYPVPVILVLYNQDTMEGYWGDVSNQLRSPLKTAERFVVVDRSNKLTSDSVNEMFSGFGISEESRWDSLEEVVLQMINTRTNDMSCPFSYFDLFTYGLTNIVRSICYDINNAVMAGSANKYLAGMPDSIDFTEDHQEFAFTFIKFLIRQNLAIIDYQDCLVDWNERQMQPFFVAPLTRRGRSLVDVVSKMENELIMAGKMEKSELRVAQEGFANMIEQSYHRRIPRINTFQALILSANVGDANQD